MIRYAVWLVAALVIAGPVDISLKSASISQAAAATPASTPKKAAKNPER